MTAWSTREATHFAAALVQASHVPLAALARGYFRRDGRGTIAITVRGPRPDSMLLLELRELRIGYWPLQKYRDFTAPHTTGSVRACADEILRQIETHDPSMQFVVAVVMGPQFLTVPFTLPLEAPVMLDEADGVH